MNSIEFEFLIDEIKIIEVSRDSEIFIYLNYMYPRQKECINNGVKWVCRVCKLFFS